jgi:hypothetical protein
MAEKITGVKGVKAVSQTFVKRGAYREVWEFALTPLTPSRIRLLFLLLIYKPNILNLL